MRLIILTLFLVITSLYSFSQVTGYALLDGQADNSGIKVKFYPNSPSAVLDSTTTNFNGDYSKVLSPGVYNLSFKKTGYQEKLYDNGNLIVITGNELLDSITMYTGIVQNIIGNVSGTFYDSIIYVIDGDIDILAGNTLIIQPGTQIKFSGYYNINVYGELISIGTGSNPILISSNKTNPQANDWGFINFYTGSSSNSKISNCVIEYGRIYCEYVDINITDNIIRNFVQRGIEVYQSSSYVANNEIYNFQDNGTTGIGVVTQFSNSIVECNHIFNGTGRGIMLWGGTPISQNNKVHDINMDFSDHLGIEIGGPDGDALVQNNIVYNCDRGISIDDWFSEPNKPNPTIINNTIYNNIIGINSVGGGQYGSGVIKMNILNNNTTGISGATNNQPSDISYNIIWGGSSNFNGINIPAIGQIITTNANGDPSDAYFNLFMDPLIDNANIPYLLANSPAINAGDPSTKDIGVDVTLLGCNGFPISIKNYITENIVNIFPNPTASQLTIETDLGIIEIIIVDLTGKTIKSIKQNTNVLNVAELPSGIYFIKLITDEKTITKKIIKQ
jgi:Secretion system C-terminal sorting domain/Right handed beta helix region